jgi:hypothetical protein
MTFVVQRPAASIRVGREPWVVMDHGPAAVGAGAMVWHLPVIGLHDGGNITAGRYQAALQVAHEVTNRPKGGDPDHGCTSAWCSRFCSV